MSRTIPSRIIQTGKSRVLPLVAQAAVANLKCLNPDFEYVYFDDADVLAFVQNEFPRYLETFERFPFRIQKYDFFRYLAVYRLGGFYFDLDVFLARGLHELLAHSCVFPFEELTINQCLRRVYGMEWEIGNYAFAAAPEHPFLKAVIENCIRAQRDPDWSKPMMTGIPRPFRSNFQVLNTTGPGLLSRTLAEYGSTSKDVTVLFPKNVCDVSTWHRFGDFGVHLMDGSWRTGGSYLRNRLTNIWEAACRRKWMKHCRASGEQPFLPETVSTLPFQ